MSLHLHEQRILAGIEDQLSRSDPALADLFAGETAAVGGRTCLRSFGVLGLLLVVLPVLVSMYPMAARGGAVGVGLLTVVLVVPWMVATARVFASEPTPQRSQTSSAERDNTGMLSHRLGYRSIRVATRARPSDVPPSLAIGLILGAIAITLVLDPVEIAVLVAAVVLLVVAHIMRWRVRRAVFRRGHDIGTEA